MFKDNTLDEIDARTRTALADYGFGVLTEIDVKVAMKKKLLAIYRFPFPGSAAVMIQSRTPEQTHLLAS